MAQLVDGTLGMGFGVTSASVLLFIGVAHWREGNIDKAILLRVAVPGAIGGFLGAVVLTNISLESAKGWMAGLLIFFGLVIFARFGLGLRLIPTPKNGHTARWLSPIGL